MLDIKESKELVEAIQLTAGPVMVRADSMRMTVMVNIGDRINFVLPRNAEVLQALGDALLTLASREWVA